MFPGGQGEQGRSVADGRSEARGSPLTQKGAETSRLSGVTLKVTKHTGKQSWPSQD